MDEAILNQIAGTVNNVSVTYNMGLTVQVTPLPCGQMTSEAFSGQVYAWAEACFGWYDDYPWALDFLGPILITRRNIHGSGRLEYEARWERTGAKRNRLTLSRIRLDWFKESTR